MAPAAKLVNPDDLQQILADALTSFSPLAALVGANSTRSLSNHTSNSKQLWATSLAPIGALGIMSTICKGSKLSALKDLLGAGESDIFDACAELGCASLYGVCPTFSKRGGLTCHSKNRNAGIAACAVLRADWKLATDGNQDPGKDQLDFTELSKFLTTIYMSTISGRLVWDVQDRDAWRDMITRIRQHLLQSWDVQNEDWDIHNLLPSFQGSNDPELRNASGMIELHWPSPSMPLETNASIVFLFIAIFITIPVAVGVIAAVPITNWQTPAASALLLGGQGILGLGHFLSQVILRRQRRSVHLDIPRQHLSDSWMLVDNVWFTSQVAKRRVSFNPLSPHTATIGQYVEMKPELPTWEVLITLATIGIGFLAFYIGARSSHLWVILFEIVFFFAANLCKGYVITMANKAYITPLNNPGFTNVVKDGLEEKRAFGKGMLASLFSLLRRPTSSREQDTELKLLKGPSQTSLTDEKKALQQQNDVPSSASPIPVQEPYMIPLPPSVASSIAGPSRPTSIHNEPSPLVELQTPTSFGSSVASRPTSPSAAADPLLPLQPEDPASENKDQLSVATSRSHRTGAQSQSHGPLPDSHPRIDIKYRIYTKVAARRQDAIGLFYFSSPQAWGTAAHIIYEACHDQIQWSPHMRKEPILLFPFTHFKKEEEAKPSPTKAGTSPSPDTSSATKASLNGKEKGKEKAVEQHHPTPPSPPKQTPIESCLVLALDETRSEDMFWAAGQEFMSIIVGAFTDKDRLVSEYTDSTDPNLFGYYVYFTTRLILLACSGPYASSPNPTPTWQMAAGVAPFLDRADDGGMYPGVASMMRAIEIVRRKYVFDSGSYAVPMMRHHARAAVHSVFGT